MLQSKSLSDLAFHARPRRNDAMNMAMNGEQRVRPVGRAEHVPPIGTGPRASRARIRHKLRVKPVIANWYDSEKTVVSAQRRVPHKPERTPPGPHRRATLKSQHPATRPFDSRLSTRTTYLNSNCGIWVFFIRRLSDATRPCSKLHRTHFLCAASSPLKTRASHRHFSRPPDPTFLAISFSPRHS